MFDTAIDSDLQLINQIASNNYYLAKTAYVLALSNSPKKTQYMNMLKNSATVNHGKCEWLSMASKLMRAQMHKILSVQRIW